MDENDDQVDPTDVASNLHHYRARVISGDLTLEEAARDLAQENAPHLSLDGARTLLAVLTPAAASAEDSRFRRTIRRRKIAATLGFLAAAVATSVSAVNHALDGQGSAAFWAGSFTALLLYALVLTREYMSLSLFLSQR